MTDTPPLPRACSFAEDDWHALSRCWHPIAFSHELGPAPAGASSPREARSEDAPPAGASSPREARSEDAPPAGAFSPREARSDDAPPAGAFSPREARSEDAPPAGASSPREAPRKATLLDLDLVLWRTPAGEVAVARDLCPHRGTPLSMGWVEGETIVCPYHGFRYGPDGACRLIPAHPDRPIPPRMRLASFPAVERYGLVWARLAGDLPAEEGLPDFPAWDDAAYQRITPPCVDIAGSPGRQVEGFLDVAHFAWVHAETFADADNPLVPPYRVTPTARGVEAHYWSSVPNWPKGLEGPTPEGFLWLRHFAVFPPFCALLTVHFPGEDRLCILNAASPISARKTRLFVPIAKNFGTDQPVEPVHEFNARIFAEDQAIVENQKPEDLPLDLTAEAHITADRMSLAYRQLLARMGLGRGFTA